MEERVLKQVSEYRPLVLKRQSAYLNILFNFWEEIDELDVGAE